MGICETAGGGQLIRKTEERPRRRFTPRQPLPVHQGHSDRQSWGGGSKGGAGLAVVCCDTCDIMADVSQWGQL